MSRMLTALLVLLLSVPCALPGQASAPTAAIRPGDRVRITQAGESPRVAVVVSRTDDTLLVRWPEFANTVTVPLAGITRLDVSSGRHRKLLMGATVGTLSGGMLGALVGTATYTPCTSTEAFGCLLAPTSSGESALIGGVVGGVLGLVVGTLVGLPSREDWRSVPLGAPRVAMSVTPRGGATGIGVSLRF